MKNVKIQKSGWNKAAALAGPFWYIYKGMLEKGFIMLAIVLCTIGIGLIPIWIYCSYSANKDFYGHVKQKGYYIFNK